MALLTTALIILTSLVLTAILVKAFIITFKAVASYTLMFRNTVKVRGLFATLNYLSNRA